MTMLNRVDAVAQERAKNLCHELRMLGSPTRGDHLGEKQSGTILWERDGWPFVEARIAQAIAEALRHDLLPKPRDEAEAK